jgi:hypothetical protein
MVECEKSFIQTTLGAREKWEKGFRCFNNRKFERYTIHHRRRRVIQVSNGFLGGGNSSPFIFLQIFGFVK